MSWLVTWCRLSITSLLRAAHFPVNWSRNASVSTTFHCTKRANWTTQPRNTFLVTWWNRRDHFTWVWWFAVITLVRACAVRTEELVLADLLWSASVWKDSVDLVAKVRTFFPLAILMWTESVLRNIRQNFLVALVRRRVRKIYTNCRVNKHTGENCGCQGTKQWSLQSMELASHCNLVG